MKRILIVDDIKENIYLLRSLFEGHGYEVEQASNGSEALVKALTQPPAIIITDILMPVIDGYTLCRIWKADPQLSMVPLIFYTATYTDPRDEKLARDMGADAFIIKPVEPDEFLRQVERILALSEEGKRIVPQKPTVGEQTILKNYNEVLIRKLEQKMVQLEKLNMKLTAEIAERNKVEESLRESEEHFRILFHKHAAVKLIIDPGTGDILDANQAAVDYYGWPYERLLRMRVYDIHNILPEEFAADVNKTKNREATRFEYRLQNPDGASRVIEVFNSLIEIQGKDHLFSIVHDITDRIRAEEQINKSLKEKEALLRELYHRTRNNMGVISSLMGLQASNSKDPLLQAAFSETRNRINAMALVHQKLYESSDLSRINLKDYSNDLVRSILLNYSIPDEQVTLALQMEDVFVLIDTAIPCGLILNELVSNIMKHAFPAGRKGVITIQLCMIEGDMIRLGVRDDGVGFSSGFNPYDHGRMGMKTVFALAERQLGATIEVVDKEGVAWALQFKDNRYQARV